MSRQINGQWGKIEFTEQIPSQDDLIKKICSLCACDLYAPPAQTITTFVAAFQDATLQFTPLLLTAVADKEIIGFLQGRAYLDEAEIDYVLVHRDLRKQGIAREILACFIELCQNHAIERILLEVGNKNVAAQKLYLHHGFRFIGKRKGYYRSGEDALVMEWRK